MINPGQVGETDQQVRTGFPKSNQHQINALGHVLDHFVPVALCDVVQSQIYVGLNIQPMILAMKRLQHAYVLFLLQNSWSVLPQNVQYAPHSGE